MSVTSEIISLSRNDPARAWAPEVGYQPKRVRMLQCVGAVNQAITRATLAVVFVLFVLMMLDIWASVLCRYILVSPISWADQVAKYLMIWASFLAASVGVRLGAHVGIDLVVARFGGRLRRLISFLSYAAVATFLLTLFYQGLLFCLSVRFQSVPLVFELNMAVPYAAIPVSAFLMFVQLRLGQLLPGQREEEG